MIRMTYRGHVRNGAVVLDAPVVLPEGAAVEVSVVPAIAHPRPPVASIDELRGDAAGDDDFGDDFDQTIRRWRAEPWRSSPQEPLE
jgi:hypothetical protein